MPATKPSTGPPFGISERILKTITYFASTLILGLLSSALGPTLTGLAENTGSTLSQIGVLFAARSLGYVFGSLLAGRLYDRVPGHPVMGGMLLLMALGTIFVPLSPWLWALVLLILLLGIAEGTLDVGGNTLLLWVHGDEAGPYINGLHFCFGLGAFISPLIVARALALSGEINWAYWSICLVMVPVAAWIFFRPSPPIRDVDGDAQGPRTLDGVLIGLLVLFFFLYVGAEIGFSGWIATYAVVTGMGDAGVGAYLTSAFWGALTVGRLFTIPLSRRVPPRRLLLADLTGALLSIGLILLLPSSASVAWIATMGMGLSLSAVFPTTLYFAERRMRVTGRITSWFFIGSSMGAMILPWLMGQFFETAEPRVTMLAVLGDLLVMVGVFAALLVRSKDA